ncbi:MAG: GNAT family N-acetyltransferase [Ilumatobacteraceae bacterium]
MSQPLETAVRRLRADDVEVLVHLEHVCRAAAGDYRGAAVLLEEVPPVHDWRTRIDDDEHPVWVATIDGVAAGYLAAEVGDGLVTVQQVFVHPGARELGLGDELLAAVLAAGREWGCRRLDGAALPGDRLTKNLYERAGITARKIIVSTQLD